MNQFEKEQKSKGKKKHGLSETIKVILVGLLCFFGAGFSIMAFHNDIGIRKLFAEIYYQIMGEESDGCTILEISYSIGLFAGIMLFFNHCFGKKICKDFTPIEVEMVQYRKAVEDAIQEAEKEKCSGNKDEEWKT